MIGSPTRQRGTNLITLSPANASGFHGMINAIFVQHAAKSRRSQRADERRHIGAAAKRLQLHEQPDVGSLRLSVFRPSTLADVRRLGPPSHLGLLRHGFSIIRGLR